MTLALTPGAATARASAGAYVGLVTRSIAFAVDAAVINAVSLTVGAVFALTFSVLKLPSDLRTVAVAIGGVVYVLWVVGYFVTFWSTTGQTPGNRLLRIRVRAAGGERIKPTRALARFIALVLAALPLGAGVLLILVDDRRRGLHDRLARTVVVEAPEDQAAAPASSPIRPSRP